MFEHELNFVTEELHLRAKSEKAFKKDILKFYSIVCPNYYTFLVETLDKKTLDALFADMYVTGLVPVEQAPFFGNADIVTMQDVYREFKIDKVKFEGIQTPLVFGRMYFTKLKHEPKKKLSARSTGLTSLLDIPYKSSEAYKRGNALYNNNPVKMGEHLPM